MVISDFPIPAASSGVSTAKTAVGIQASIKREFDRMISSWEAKLPFCVQKVLPRNDCPLSNDYPHHSNILEFCDPDYKGYKIFFDPSQYPPPADGDAKSIRHDPNWLSFKSAIALAAFEQGYVIIASGSTKTQTASRVFTCQRSSCHKAGGKGKETPEFRATALHNDRSTNSRGPSGLGMARRTATDKPVCPSQICKFRLVVQWNSHGIYMVGGIGNSCHKSHLLLRAEDISLPTRLAKPKERTMLESVSGARAHNGVGRNIFFTRNGHYLSRDKIRTLNGSKETFNFMSIANVSSMDGLVSYISEDPTLCSSILYDEITPVTAEASGSQSEQQEVLFEASCLPQSVVQDFTDEGQMYVYADKTTSDAFRLQMLNYSSNQRRELQVTHDQKLVLAVAWGTQDAIRLFKLFPHVVYLDVTMDTNNEGRPCLTFSIRSSDGKQIVFLTIFLPHEQASSFRWAFQSVLPKLLGSHSLKQIRVIITDGDSQETSQVDMLREAVNAASREDRRALVQINVNTSISSALNTSLRVRCGWHIVEKGFARQCPKKHSVAKPKHAKFEKLERTVKAWIYSWMKPGNCESKVEYDISKALLTEYLKSAKVVEIFEDSANPQGAKQIRDWIARNVEPLEAHFAHHLRSHLLHFDSHMNTAHEGTNNGLKSHGAAVLASHSVARAANTMNMQTTLKCQEVKISAAASLTKVVLWSKLPAKDDVTKLCLGLLEGQWQLRNNYTGFRLNATTWKVVCHDSNRCDENAGPIPNFRRVRVVTLNSLGELLCTCRNFERTGYPCRHAFFVICDEFPHYDGPTCNDVSVYWWNFYYVYGQRPTDHPEIHARLQDLAANDTKGPSLPCALPLFDSELPLPRMFETVSPFASLVNYTEAPAKAAYCRMFGSLPGDASQLELTTSIFGHSQEHFNYNEEDYPFADNDVDSVQPGGDEAVSLYSALNPAFKLMCNLAEGNYTPEDIDLAKEVFTKIQDNAQKRRRIELGGTLPGTWVSSQAAAPRVNYNRRKLGAKSGPHAGR
jgi:hypothetical protein